jgi:hypothetical protein
VPDHNVEPTRLPYAKRLVVIASAALTVVGVFDAMQNLPIVSGCAFYAQCHKQPSRAPTVSTAPAHRDAR